ncbi:YoaK family protein [Neoroseomonas lacus]|nr:YoaK family protein [Neoroseomonas lacus]
MTTLAGFDDAVGYMATGHLYLSFMSGNSTQLGMALARGDARSIILSAVVIGAFMLGAFLGSLMSAVEARAHLPLVLICEVLCFALAWMLLGPWTAHAALLFVALAMGMQNANHVAIGGASIGRSYVTGALFGVGDALARACLGKTGVAEAGVYATTWLAFIACVIGGAATIEGLRLPAALLAGAGVVAALIVLSMIWRRPGVPIHGGGVQITSA